jgi:hypothetical protein
MLLDGGGVLWGELSTAGKVQGRIQDVRRLRQACETGSEPTCPSSKPLISSFEDYSPLCEKFLNVTVL